MRGLRVAAPAARRSAHRVVDSVAGGFLGSVDAVRTDRSLVALTFDDGPDREWTPRVLDSLADHRSRATFFMLVQNARRLPGLVQRVVAEGHEVALHGADHRSLAGSSRRATKTMLDEAARELQAISGAPVTFFRPPFGDQTVASFLGVRGAGLQCVVWGVDSEDWRGGDPRDVATDVITRAAAGDIILFHDGCAGDGEWLFDRAKTVDLVLDGFERRSLCSATLSTLVTSGHAHRTVWFSRSHPNGTTLDPISTKGVPT